MSQGQKRTGSDGRLRYWAGSVAPVERPRNYQQRVGGPPLLFATDIRMTILVTLAVGATMRPMTLWKTIGKKAVLALDGLIDLGLVVRRKFGRNRSYVALDPAHQCAVPLRLMLLPVARHYHYENPELGPLDESGTELIGPKHNKDVLETFADIATTLPLLVVYVLGRASARGVAQANHRVKTRSARQQLWKFRAHGLLTAQLERDARTTRCREHVFRFDYSHPLTTSILAVLAVVDQYAPLVRVVAQDQAS